MAAQTAARRSRKRPRPVARRTARRPSRTAKRNNGPSRFGRTFLPGLLSLVMLGCIGFLVVMGYRTVTASEFFDVKQIEIRGTARASRQQIEKIVAANTARSGAWNADLEEIRARIEKLPFVKTAAVSRVLPNGILVSVNERVPQAIVRLSTGDYLVDGEAEILAVAGKSEGGLPIALRGWDESKTEKAATDNLHRIKMFQKMLDEWGAFELGRRVSEVDLADLSEPKTLIDESGHRIWITLGKNEFGKSLKSAVEAVAGKGEKIRSVDASGVYPIVQYKEF